MEKDNQQKKWLRIPTPETHSKNTNKLCLRNQMQKMQKTLHRRNRKRTKHPTIPTQIYYKNKNLKANTPDTPLPTTQHKQPSHETTGAQPNLDNQPEKKTRTSLDQKIKHIPPTWFKQQRTMPTPDGRRTKTHPKNHKRTQNKNNKEGFITRTSGDF